MQRLSNLALSIALIVFVMAVSLALMAASWLMVTQLLNGPARFSLPRWLFLSLFVVGLIQANAQSSVPDAYEVVDAYVKPTTSTPIATFSDTLGPVVQTNMHRHKRRIKPKPAWSDEERAGADRSDEPDPSFNFYIMAIEPNPSAYNYGHWFRSRL